MTIKTRDQKFKESFHKFIETLNIGGIHYNLSYCLKNETNNQSKCLHNYTLQVLGSIEGMFSTGENVIELLPTNKDFIDAMYEYYAPFFHNSTPCKSFIEIISRKNDNIISVIKFDILYYKDFLPFPLILTPIQELEAEVDDLSFQNTLLRKRYNKTKKMNETYIKVLRNAQLNVQKKMKEVYKNSKELLDCPVCMDSIQLHNLYTPLCFHSICVSCKDRCTNCPLCRQCYIVEGEQYV